ncbi:MAG: hypothetical protein V4857_11755 [Pseudomonadota bacterium]
MKATMWSALICASVGMSGAAAADDLSINGFGTLGAVRTDSDDAQFVRYNQAKGVTTRAGIGTDTNLGLQADYRIGARLSGTVQLLTRRSTGTSFTTELSWAFLKYRLSDDFNLRVGRVALPIFMVSDFQNVGYANTMMRPPIELYSQAPIENADGVDLLYQHSFGDTTLSGQLSSGVSRGKLFTPVGGGAVVNYRAPVAALSVSAEHGPLTLRLSHTRIRMGSDNFGALNNTVAGVTAAGFAQLGRDLTIVGGKRVAFSALGMTFNHNMLVLQAEYGWRRGLESSFFSETNAWYAMAGYRVGKLLPYYAHASLTQSGSSVVLPAGFPGAGPLHNAVAVGFLTAAEQRSDLVGLRWDFAAKASLKVQLDRVKPLKKSGSLIFGPAAGLSKPVTAVGVSIDYVF